MIDPANKRGEMNNKKEKKTDFCLRGMDRAPSVFQLKERKRKKKRVRQHPSFFFAFCLSQSRGNRMKTRRGGGRSHSHPTLNRLLKVIGWSW